ncbi:hypothetical protein DCO58_04335 [Helicobacter saguini]|uniref:Uncharacterized protein n=1 Tax=Helicobacter saguini TaxID=1548018 RepID=A0A4U8T1S7_9HELI|nr:T6SS effector amidase Tae4 family protein [Helicobacter saguini]MWV62416.1 hypothetical protein [Helicobacter saguini]MWV66912.1 hypothetical protein [Helicobacter saguini]MWV69261.1 hypothetical protein [Helicobacter saguini]MWV71184.1 hypothetical protein [Helicobacter saguini]TLD93335.1 hypothetical protein LS64_008870 [Helicobacter saguini]
MKKLKAKCGNLETTINIQRPSFESVKKNYVEITMVGSKEYIEKYKLIQINFNNGNITQEEAKEEIRKLRIDMSEARYKTVSNKLLNFFNEDRESRYNTCATRISYAINNTAIPLTKTDNQKSPTNAWIINNSYYGISVDSVIDILSTLWHKPKVYNATIKQSILNGCTEDFYHKMNTKEQNQSFFKELQSFKRKGVAAMRLHKNRIRHTTLWEENEFVDVKMNDESDLNYSLYGYNYLTNEINDYPAVSEFYFWELK